MEKKKRSSGFVSIYLKLFLLSVVLCIIPMVIVGIIIYQIYADSLMEILLQNMERTVYRTADDIENLMADMDNSAKRLYQYQISEYDYFYQLLQDEEITENKRSILIEDVLYGLIYGSSDIRQSCFVASDGRYYGSRRIGNERMDEEKLHSFCRKYYRADNRQVYFIPEHTDSYFYDSANRVVTFARNIMNTDTVDSSTEEILGTIYIDIDADVVEEIMAPLKNMEGSSPYFLDDQGNLLYGEDSLWQKDQDSIKPLLSGTPGDARQTWKSEKNYYMLYRMETGGFIAERITDNFFMGRVRGVMIGTVTVILCGIVLMLLLYWVYTRTFSRPIREMQKMMGEIERGNLEYRVETKRNDEIGIIMRGLNEMTANLQNYIQRVYISDIRQKEAELDVLKTQIRPHYLYNTLDVIRMSAIIHDDKDTAEMLHGLSHQFHYLLGPGKVKVQLQDELNNIRNYFEIIRVRYKNRISLEINVPSELQNIYMPKVVLQPIVENAVKYGLEPKKGRGFLEITAKKTGQNLEISVMDNGAGMSRERLTEVREMIEEDWDSEKDGKTDGSVGLKNVNDRIRLACGAQYGIKVDSQLGMGTIVKCILPAEERKDQDG